MISTSARTSDQFGPPVSARYTVSYTMARDITEATLIRRDKQGDTCDFWHRIRCGIVGAVLIFVLPHIVDLLG